MTKPLVIVTRKLPVAVEAALAERFEVRLNSSDVPLTEAELKVAAAEADGLLVTLSDRLSAEVIAAAGPRLKIIANFGVGFDHIDIAACKAKGIVVSNTPDVLTEDTADTALLLMLGVMRRAAEGEQIVRQEAWGKYTPTFLLGSCLAGKALGIVGMGRIGQAVARRAKAFGMSIHYHNRRQVDAAIERETGARYWPDLNAMLAAMDVISLNCPATPETKHLMSAPRLAMLKTTAYLINTARGNVVDEAALVAALESGKLAGAGLDVYEAEPKVQAGLLASKKVFLLPHIGSATVETRTAMGMKCLANLEAALSGAELLDKVA